MKRARISKKEHLKQVAFTRFMLVLAFFVLWIGGISVRLVHLQVTQHTWLRERAVDMRQDIRQSRMLRGTIYDRGGRALAMSLRVKTLYADATEMPDVGVAAKAISSALKIDEKPLLLQLQQAKAANKRYLPIAKKLDEEAVQKLNKSLDVADVRKADLPNYAGLHWKDEQKRSYPQQTLAAQVIGFSNDADEGVAGIEQSQDEILHGALIRKLQQRDRYGRIYDEEIAEREAPSDVVLTIDSALQYMVEQALEKGVRDSEAKSGMAVVLSVKTGEVLAIANYPTFDLNAVNAKSVSNITNHAVQSSYAPGSVFKLVTYGSGLEKNLFNPGDMISSGNGTIEVADHVFKDSHAVGTVSYSQAMAHSSNVCAIKTAMSVGREDFSGMIQRMGFGTKTGIELPAETSGIVRPVAKWNGDSLASMSIGYEIGVTALQMTTSFATIANNGVRVQPRIIKEIRKSGEAAQAPMPAEQPQVVTPETARKLRTMLKQVVLTGTGRRAQLNGYTAAGKTGTAWKFNPKTKSIDPSKYISSFIGMAPAENPEIVVGVIMDEPRSGARDGGMVSAPVFREIAQQLLHELKVPTDAPIDQQTTLEKDIPESPVESSPTSKSDKKLSDTTQKADRVKPKESQKNIKDPSKNTKDSNEKRNIAKERLTAFLPKRQFNGIVDTNVIET